MAALEEPNKKILDWKTFKRLAAFVKPYKGWFFFLLFLTIFVALLGPVRPLLVERAVNNYIAYNDYQGLVFIIMVMIALLMLQAIIQYSHTYLSGWLGQTVIKDIRVKLYRHILGLKLRFYDKTPIGRLVTRNISDIETLSNVFSQGIAALLGDILLIITILIVMFATHWKLTLISLSLLPLLLLSTYIFKEKIKVAFDQTRTAVSNLNSFVQEHITGMSIVQIFGSEKNEYQKFKEINQRINIKR